MSSSAAVVLAVLCAEPGYRADAKELFEGCRPKTEGANSRLYSCRGWGAAIAETFSKVALDAEFRRDMLLAGLHGMLPGEMTQTALAERRSGGRTVTSLRVKPAARERWAFAEGAMIELAPGHQRVVMCSAGAADDVASSRCAKVVAYLVDVGTPDGVELGTPGFTQEPVLLGRMLAVPGECRAEISAENVGRILCPDSLLAWMVIPDAADPMKYAENMARDVARVQKLTIDKERLACTIEGKPGECLRVSGVDVQIIGARLEGSSVVVVSCGSNDPLQPLKPVCRGALSLTKPGR